MPSLHLTLFGGPRLQRHDEQVPLTPYQACLLTLVASGGPRGVTRRKVMSLFWRGGVRPEVRHRLRQLLHDLRGRLGSGALGGDEADPLFLDREIVEADLWRWEKELVGGSLLDAAHLIAEGFVPLLDQVPTEAYADWVEASRRRLEGTLVERAKQAWHQGRESARWPLARDAAEALFRLMPQDGTVAAHAMEARAMTSGPADAEEVFLRHEGALEPGETPDPRVCAVRDRLRNLAGRHSRLHAATPGPVPIVGREEVLADIDARLEAAETGTLELILLTGAAGIGKTRILWEVRKRAEVQGYRVLASRPTKVEQRVPLHALVAALTEMDLAEDLARLGEPWRTLVAGFLPYDERIPTLPEVPPIQESGLSRRLLDALFRLFKRLVDHGPLLVCIDDLQWADDTTLAVLQFIQRRWDGDGPLAFICTARSPEETGRRWPSPFLNELGRAATYRHDVGELDEEQARSLIRLTAGRSLQPDQEERLLALGGRHPFYLVELTRDHTAGRIQLVSRPGEPPPLPISLQELFEYRLARLEPAPREVAETLAIRGRPMALADLALLTGLSLEETAEAVEALQQQSLATVESGSAAVGHELFRRAFYRRVSPARLAVRHLRIAEHLAAGQVDPPHGEIAVHLARGGRRAEAAHHAREAADQAVERGAVADAIHLVRIVAENEPESLERAMAKGELGQLLHLSRDMERAAPILERAGEELRLVGRRSDALRLDIRRLDSLVEVSDLGIPDALERLQVIRAKAETEADWVAIAMALDTELHLLHQSGDVGHIDQLLDNIRVCTQSGDREAECLAHAGLAMSILFGDPAEGLASSREAVAIAEEEGFKDHLLRAQTRLILVLGCLAQLRSEEGRAAIRAARDSTNHQAELRILLDANLAAFHLDAGDLHMAEDAFQEIESTIRKIPQRFPRVHLDSNLGELYLARRDPEKARACFSRAIEVAPKRLTTARTFATAGLGIAALRLGRIHEATSILARIRLDVGRWYFDPFLPISLKAELEERQHTLGNAMETVDTALRGTSGRLVGSWLKLATLKARMAAQHGLQETLEDICSEGIAVCAAKGLVTRERQFRAFLKRDGGKR